MPHINHRRGDTRRRCEQPPTGRFPGRRGWWNRTANHRLRVAIRHVLRHLRSRGFDIEECEDTVWPIAREADDVWGYD